ncbi:MAG: SDR family NAD(P)-dependent oxidoreductase [Betaproteobacteria bacterium]|nr:SDR family NAD(P)-dependent oxidoreductase [Betaproteobacteria bacterium]
MQQKIVLITGCSSGIGAALAEEFHRLGHIVYASARTSTALSALTVLGVRGLSLDVTDAQSIVAAMARIKAEQGRLDVLVNNAGFGLFGAVADLSAEDLRRQLDTNVVGPVQVLRAALPLMLPQRRACVVNIGSVAGITPTPFSGGYSASKAALHILSDAMRMELAPFGIHVLTVQPGSILSRFGSNSMANVALPADSIYGVLAKRIRARAGASQKGGMSAEVMAQMVAAAALQDHPPAILRIGPNSFRMPALKRWWPVAWLDRKYSRMFALERLAGGSRQDTPQPPR